MQRFKVQMMAKALLTNVQYLHQVTRIFSCVLVSVENNTQIAVLYLKTYIEVKEKNLGHTNVNKPFKQIKKIVIP